MLHFPELCGRSPVSLPVLGESHRNKQIDGCSNPTARLEAGTNDCFWRYAYFMSLNRNSANLRKDSKLQVVG
jgi:hypothetical protein